MLSKPVPILLGSSDGMGDVLFSGPSARQEPSDHTECISSLVSAQVTFSIHSQRFCFSERESRALMVESPAQRVQLALQSLDV